MNCSTHTCEYCFKTCNIFCGCRGEREAIEREREKTAGFSYCRRCGMEKKTMFCSCITIPDEGKLYFRNTIKRFDHQQELFPETKD